MQAAGLTARDVARRIGLCSPSSGDYVSRAISLGTPSWGLANDLTAAVPGTTIDDWCGPGRRTDLPHNQGPRPSRRAGCGRKTRKA